MEDIVIQGVKVIGSRTGASKIRTGASKIRMGASKIRMGAAKTASFITDSAEPVATTVNIETINVNALVMPNSGEYFNGGFIPVFQGPLIAIARDAQIKGGDLRVLIFILGSVDEKNCIVLSLSQIASYLHVSEDTVRRAIKKLTDMHIICKREGSSGNNIYELSDKILNPRLAYKGNTKKIRTDVLPLLLAPDGEVLLPQICAQLDL